MSNSSAYPDSAYSDTGVLWWKLTNAPGSKRAFGGEQKIAAWLAYNRSTGETFTMRDLRDALGDATANDQEHLNRRLRTLRTRDGWIIQSNQDDSSLSVAEYRVTKVGWHPGLGEPRAASTNVSNKNKRLVLERDGSRCVICGVGAGEEYPGDPGTTAAITAGHITPNARGGSSSDLNNLRAECARCNEVSRDTIRPPESFAEVLPDIKILKTADQKKLLSWLQLGQRGRDKVDNAYDRARVLSEADRTALVDFLLNRLGMSD